MEETEQEFINNTEALLAKIDLDFERVDDLFRIVTDSVADRKLKECYLVFKYLSKYIEDFMECCDEEKQWYDYVANRCFIIKKEIEAVTNSELIH